MTTAPTNSSASEAWGKGCFAPKEAMANDRVFFVLGTGYPDSVSFLQKLQKSSQLPGEWRKKNNFFHGSVCNPLAN